MQCGYFDAGECSSCTLIEQPYPRQRERLVATVGDTLAGHVDESHWLPMVFGPESGFRNKAKLAVGGTRQAPTFGILDDRRRGVDLRSCGLYEPGLHEALGPLCDAVSALGLTPYGVTSRSGEFKHLIVTHSPRGELMARFVLRSAGQREKIRRGLPLLRAAAPNLRVVSVNLQPEHKAVLTGPTEEVLSEATTLPLPIGEVVLQLRPDSFFQTNTYIAARLYATASRWASSIGPHSVWDLYCGVGGFGLSIAAQSTDSALSVVGVEVEPGAVRAAQLSAKDVEARNPLASFDFRVGDATSALTDSAPPDLVVVNPPRRGIGPLCDWLQASRPGHLLYSSCNASSLARDLAQLDAYEVVRAQLFDMFPQTHHHEVLVLLERKDLPA